MLECGKLTGGADESIGNVYVIDRQNNRGAEGAGRPSQEMLPFNGLSSPQGVAVDAAGTLYGTDVNNCCCRRC